MSRSWTDAEKDVVRELYPTTSATILSEEHLERTAKAIRSKARDMGVKSDGKDMSKNMKPKPDGLDIDAEWEELASSTRHYYRNKDNGIVEKKTERTNRYTKKKKERCDSIKERNGCQICGEDEPCCLVFHYVNPDDKEYTVSTMFRRYSIEKIINEISKCAILCANCHRKYHAGSIDKSKDLSTVDVNTDV